jgi:hypothetical protein
VNRNAYTELTLTPGIQSNSASSQLNPNGTPNFVIGVPSTQIIVNDGVDGDVPMVSFYLDGGFNMTGIRNYGNALPNPMISKRSLLKRATSWRVHHILISRESPTRIVR